MQLRRLVDASPQLARVTNDSGGFAGSVHARALSLARPDLVDENRAAIWRWGIAIGHERLARFAGLDRNSELVRAAAALRRLRPCAGGRIGRGTTASARRSRWWKSLSERRRCLIKEELDALTLGSGFSFGDLAADRAGVRFADAATDSEAAA
jgi:hypothetical protein